ncbi:MAG: type VI secretion system protein TssA [Deltaproteobacteria bacterium]|nr:type VI secretion system protein TssA [Deltaproteobacteria bacterium]
MNLESLGKEPISQDQPTGADIRFEPLFEDLQSEVGKLSSISGPASVDWGKVLKLSSEILSEKSKDLLVASYLAVALIYKQQVEGFAIGLKIYQDLLETFWDRLYPAKTKGRAGAVEWWIEKAEGALKQVKQRTLPQDQINALNERLEKIEEFLGKNLEELPSFNAILDQLETLSPPPPEKPKDTPPPPTEKTTREEPEAPAVPTTPQDAQKILNHGLQKIREAVSFFHQENLSNPQPYRWSRIILWSNVEALPPATNGQTRIPPPPAQVKNIFSELRNKGDNESLIRAAEGRLPQFIFWIDLNRFASEGLANLGENYQKAKESVIQETAFLLNRLPGLEHLSFSDGTPFADSETKQWIKEIAFKRGGAEEPSSQIATPQDKHSIEKEVEEAQALIKKGKLLEAIEGLQQKFQHSSSQREKLLWRLAMSQLLVKNKQAKVALPHLEQILKDIDFYRLEEYDPELAIKSLKAVWIGFSSQSDQPSKEKASEVLQRIAKLDLTEAIRIGKT